jgi:TIR domain-containing protein
MTGERKHLYVSYARQDAETVRQFVQHLDFALRQCNTPVGIWMDREALTPGDAWQKTIEEAIRSSVGVLVFFSPASMLSEFVLTEVKAAVADHERLVIPIALGEIPDAHNYPHLQDIKLQVAPTSEQMAEAAQKVALVIAGWLSQHPQTPPPLIAPEVKKFAADAAESVRAATSRQTEDDRTPPDSVFVVHGHDAGALRDVCNVLSGS